MRLCIYFSTAYNILGASSLPSESSRGRRGANNERPLVSSSDESVCSLIGDGGVRFVPLGPIRINLIFAKYNNSVKQFFIYLYLLYVNLEQVASSAVETMGAQRSFG